LAAPTRRSVSRSCPTRSPGSRSASTPA